MQHGTTGNAHAVESPVAINLTMPCVYDACGGVAVIGFTHWRCASCKQTWSHDYNLTAEQLRQLKGQPS